MLTNAENVPFKKAGKLAVACNELFMFVTYKGQFQCYYSLGTSDMVAHPQCVRRFDDYVMDPYELEQFEDELWDTMRES